ARGVVDRDRDVADARPWIRRALEADVAEEIAVSADDAGLAAVQRAGTARAALADRARLRQRRADRHARGELDRVRGRAGLDVDRAGHGRRELVGHADGGLTRAERQRGPEEEAARATGTDGTAATRAFAARGARGAAVRAARAAVAGAVGIDRAREARVE